MMGFDSDEIVFETQANFSLLDSAICIESKIPILVASNNMENGITSSYSIKTSDVCYTFMERCYPIRQDFSLLPFFQSGARLICSIIIIFY